MTCTCTHTEMCHRYIRIVGANSGECLARGCDCEIYEEDE